MDPELQSGSQLHLEDKDRFESVCVNQCGIKVLSACLKRHKRTTWRR